MAAEDRSGWPVLSLVGGLEDDADARSAELHQALSLIGAIEEWVKPGRDPGTAVAEIRRLVELHRRQSWVPVDPQAEAARAQRAEDGGGPDA